MGYKTTYRGLPVEVDTLDQLDELADRAARRVLQAANGNGNGQDAALRQAVRAADQHSISRVISQLPANARNGLQILLNNNLRMRDSDYRAALGVEDNSAIGGRVTSPIQRVANQAGIEASEVISRDLVSENPRVYEYFIPAANAEQIRNALG
jgi:hypothetical protein